MRRIHERNWRTKQKRRKQKTTWDRKCKLRAKRFKPKRVFVQCQSAWKVYDALLIFLQSYLRRILWCKTDWVNFQEFPHKWSWGNFSKKKTLFAKNPLSNQQQIKYSPLTNKKRSQSLKNTFVIQISREHEACGVHKIRKLFFTTKKSFHFVRLFNFCLEWNNFLYAFYKINNYRKVNGEIETKDGAEWEKNSKSFFTSVSFSFINCRLQRSWITWGINFVGR